jgi:hypothetical protein
MVRSGYIDTFRDDASISRFWSEPDWVRMAIFGEWELPVSHGER